MYPYNINLNQTASIFDDEYLRNVKYIDMSKDKYIIEKICTNNNQKDFNNYLFKYIKNNSATCLLSGYLENGKPLLKKYPQMITKNRVYHLGLDIIVPHSTKLFTPLNGEVVLSEIEEGEGNYGGLVVIKHILNGEFFYTLYGHLDSNKLPRVGEKLSKSENFAFIGDFDTNGNWFHHLHLQILTTKAYENGWVHKGYCTSYELGQIRNLCPDPLFLFKLP